jgi:galactokinase/mevalonate kinase-like predicted kinase
MPTWAKIDGILEPGVEPLSFPRRVLTVPARINLLGNPGDANEGDYATISAAIDVRAGVLLEPAQGLVLEFVASEAGGTPEMRVMASTDDYPLPYGDRADLVKGACNRLHAFSAEFRSKHAAQGVKIATWTDVPFQSGLGGSSLFVLLTLAGLREFYDLDRRLLNDYVVAELAQRVESEELGITCGFADRYVPLFGGIAYVDYRGKLEHRDIGEEPFATYERLDTMVQDLPLVMASTGLKRDSGDVHGTMRPRYLDEHRQWQRNGGEPPPMVRLMSGAWETAWRGKTALLRGDLPKVGLLMNENHRLVDEMMSYCGFEDGAGWANNMLIETALENGALGAKLTGAGGGGSVFALTRPGEEQRLAEAFERAIASAGLSDARVAQPRVSRDGLVVRT